MTSMCHQKFYPYLMDRRRQPKEGKYESIKIPRGNVAYVPKSIRRGPLLTPSRPNSYQEAIALETGLGTAAET
jgi:hypothetical protein